jgi:hemerythrin-like domain-containing protein
MPLPSLHLRLVGTEHGAFGPRSLIDPISVIEVDHVHKLELCELLEAIADGLPHEVDAEQADLAATILREGVPDHIALEEDHLFPLLRKRNVGDPCCEMVLAELQHEHASDEAFAYEIAEELVQLAATRATRNAEMLGYMLRGFFVAQRRHVRWENAVILPLARRTLNEADLAELTEAIIYRAHMHGGRRALESVTSAIARPNGAD